MTRPLPFLAQLKWTSDGLIPAIVQDDEDGAVLMLAWMDEPAIRRTIATGQTHFYSRSRRSSWHKGGTSGHVQHVVSIRVDCDGDVLLIRARQVGGACHEGYRSCFFREVNEGGMLGVVASPVFDAGSVYKGATVERISPLPSGEGRSEGSETVLDSARRIDGFVHRPTGAALTPALSRGESETNGSECASTRTSLPEGASGE